MSTATAPAIPGLLNAAQLRALADAMDAYAVAQKLNYSSTTKGWQQLRNTGFEGAGPAAAVHRGLGIAAWMEHLTGPAEQASRILRLAASAQEVLDNILSKLQVLGPAVHFLPAAQEAYQLAVGAGTALDLACAGALRLLCVELEFFHPRWWSPQDYIDHVGYRRREAGALGPTDAVGPRFALGAGSAAELSFLNRAIVERDFSGKLHEEANIVAGFPQAQVLEVGNNHLVAAFGDVDSADKVITVVTGVGSDNAKGYDVYLQRAEQIHRSTGAATVLWMGYNPPKHLINGTSSAPAAAGARSLAAFQQGLRDRAAARGQSQRLTVLGHSYGSVTVGKAASLDQAPLAADAIVLAGSPGVGVDYATQLRTDTPGAPVVATIASDDPIYYVGQVDPPVLDKVLPAPHGRNPATPEFGATMWQSKGGHSSYWNDERFLEKLKQLANGEPPHNEFLWPPDSPAPEVTSVFRTAP